MKLTSDIYHFPNPQHPLYYTFGVLVNKAFTKVKAYIMNDSIDLADDQALITILEKAFSDPDCITIAERKFETLKHTNHNFPTYCAKF
jgi:hypothetical protein